jgi:hypothetical protein
MKNKLKVLENREPEKVIIKEITTEIRTEVP